jgi:predicted nucleic acid-binding protein
MTNGIVLFAFNNSNIDYVKQAVYCAKRVKQHLNLPVQLITDAIDYIESTYPFYKKYIDVITYTPAPANNAIKTFNDGLYASKKIEWKNSARNSAYNLSIFDKTIVIDTDLILSNAKLLACFDTNEEFMIANHYNLVNQGIESSFNNVGDKTIPMYWATILYFTKSNTAKTLFDLVGHIKENYNYYRTVYDITESKFRNDFAFSIAVHMMRGFENSNNWPKQLPSDMWVSTDTDLLVDIKNNDIKMLAHRTYDYLPVKLSDATVHIMNKFSLNSFIDREFKNE